MNKPPLAVVASSVPLRTAPSLYPEPFASRMKGRDKHPLSAVFGLTNITVNLTRLAPNAVSALRHAHAVQDEFVYILEGHPTLLVSDGPVELAPGMCAGFKAGSGDAHCLQNNTNEDVAYLEAGDNTPGDGVTYPDDDLKAVLEDGKWRFLHKDGTAYG